MIHLRKLFLFAAFISGLAGALGMDNKVITFEGVGEKINMSSSMTEKINILSDVFELLKQQNNRLEEQNNQIQSLTKRLEEQTIKPGTIIGFGGTETPSGYLLCDGSLVSQIQYAELFKAIGHTYFNADEEDKPKDSFYVPDYRGKTLVGEDLVKKTLTRKNKLGDSAGKEKVTLTISQIPEHTHNFSAVLGEKTTNVQSKTSSSFDTVQGLGLQKGETSKTGGNLPIFLMQPYSILRWFIKY